jgi:hypothetical protein
VVFSVFFGVFLLVFYRFCISVTLIKRTSGDTDSP